MDSNFGIQSRRQAHWPLDHHNHSKKCFDPGLFLHIIVLFRHHFSEKLLTLKLDHQSRRYARWPLEDYYHSKNGFKSNMLQPRPLSAYFLLFRPHFIVDFELASSERRRTRWPLDHNHHTSLFQLIIVLFSHHFGEKLLLTLNLDHQILSQLKYYQCAIGSQFLNY